MKNLFLLAILFYGVLFFLFGGAGAVVYSLLFGRGEEALGSALPREEEMP